MSISLTRLVMLAVFSGLSMNLILQLGIALKGTAFDATIGRRQLLAGMGILFTAIVLLWLLLVLVRSFLFLGFLEYILLFPVSSLAFSGLAYLTKSFILKNDGAHPNEAFFPNGVLSGGALIGAALFITLNVAAGFWETIVLSLSFTCSTALVYVVVGEIRRRSGMEAVPRWLRGGPLALIAMGLLSLVFSSGALMLFGVLGNG
jgi:electron transport complex protein RnfA